MTFSTLKNIGKMTFSTNVLYKTNIDAVFMFA